MKVALEPMTVTELSDATMAVIPTVEGRVLRVLARTDMPLRGSRIASFVPNASREGVRLAHRCRDHRGLVVAPPAAPALMHLANRRRLLWPAIERLMLAADQVVPALKLRIVERMEASFPGDTVRISLALFGSVARGDSGRDSDVDVMLIAPDDLDAALVEALVVMTIDAVGSVTGNERDVLAIARARFDEIATGDDLIIAALTADAVVFSGPDSGRRLKWAPWEGQ